MGADVNELFSKGSECFKRGDYIDALKYFDNVLKLEPEREDSWFLKGVCLANIGNHSDAILSFNKVVKIDPSNLDAWYYKGRSEIYTGQKKEALKSFDIMLSLDPDNPESNYFKGMALMELKEYEKARISFHKALKLKPDYELAWIKIGTTYGFLDNPKKALESFEKAIELNNKNPESFYMKGVVLRQSERFNESLDCFKTVLKFDPQNLASWHQIGRIFQKTGEFPKAIDAFNEVLKINPNITQAIIEKGRTLGMAGRDKEALECFNKIIKINPHNQKALDLKKIAIKLLNQKYTVNVHVGDQIINMPGIKGRENAVSIGQHFMKSMNGDNFEIIEEKIANYEIIPEKSSENYVQSCITNISFPQDLENLGNLIRKNFEYPIEYLTDLDVLFQFEDLYNIGVLGEVYYWTAPRWMTTGDILFFYHASTAKQKTRKLLKEAKKFDSGNIFLITQLEHAVQLADKYGEKIVGCCQVAGPPEYLVDNDHITHFKHRNFIPFKEVYIFDNPLDSKDFKEYVKINRAGTNTPISSHEDFEGIKKLLEKSNPIPDYLKCAKLGDKVFRNVNKNNWKEISCSRNAKFSREDQIRSYLIDYFLNEIKDNKTPLLEECQCTRDSELTGISDYFIKLNEIWIPIEAKLNVLSEKDITLQIIKYLNVDYFTPIKGKKRNISFEASKSKFGLIIDHLGLYTFYEKDFINCKPGEPIFQRFEMKNTENIRKQLITMLNSL